MIFLLFINNSLDILNKKYNVLLSGGTKNHTVSSIGKFRTLHLGMIHTATEQCVCEFSIPRVLFEHGGNHQLQISVNGISRYCNIKYINDTNISVNCDSEFYAVVYGLY